MQVPRFIPCAVVIVLFLPALTFAQCWPRSQKLLPDKALNNTEGFSRSLDHENNIAVVGAPQSDTARTSSGAVYVFQFNGSTWTKIASLTPSDHRLYHNFGTVVKIKGDYIFVGDAARKENELPLGAVYVFKKPATGWRDAEESFILKPSDTKALNFGASIDVYNNTMLVGAPYSKDANDKQVGAAYIFELQADTWVQTARLSTRATDFSTFGSNVALKNNLAVVVASEEPYPEGGTSAGSAYVFEKPDGQPWIDALPTARLQPDVSPAYLWPFGTSLAIDEIRNTVFVSNGFYDTEAGEYQIRGYIKPATGWVDKAQDFTHSLGQLFFVTPVSVQFEEPYLYYATDDGVSVTTPGPSNVWTSMTPIATLRNDDFHVMQRFGGSISINNGHILVGAFGQVDFDRDRPIIPTIPAVYDYEIPLSGWDARVHSTEIKFTYTPRTATDFSYGQSIDIDGDFAVVGAPGDNDGGRNAGAVYVFQKINFEWKRIAKLTSSNGEPHDNFGGSVAISKHIIAVSARYWDHRDENGKVTNFSSGAVYVFERPSTGWTDMKETYQLGKADAGLIDGNREDNYFGMALDVDYPYLVTSKYDEGSRPNLGSAFVFRLEEGSAKLEATLNPSMRDGVNDYGRAVKIQNNTIVVGSGATRIWFIESNIVFIYKKDGNTFKDGVESAVLRPSDVTYGAAFGFSIDMTEDESKIIIGAPGWYREGGFIYDLPNYFKGAAYIFERPASGWAGLITEKAVLTIPGQVGYGCFGISVHIEDRYAVIGSPQNYFYTNGANNPGAGKVYFYQMPEEGWKYKTPDKVIEGDEAGNPVSDYFGTAVDGVFGFMMIGAISDDNQNSIDAGSVYIYTEYPFIYPGQTPICENAEPITLEAFPVGGLWSGKGFENATVAKFDPTLAGGGVHKIKYSVDDCDASNSILIEVKKILSPFSLNARDSIFLCGAEKKILNAPPDEDLQYQWQFSATGTAYADIVSGVLPDLTTQQHGFYKANVSNECSVVSGVVWVGNLQPKAGPDFEICMSGTPQSLGGNYPNGIWSGPGVTGKSFSSATAGRGAYKLIFSVSPLPGCVYRDTLIATVKGIPVMQISPSGTETFCFTGTTTLSATSQQGVSYRWLHGNSVDEMIELSNQSKSTLQAKSLGIYKVVAFDGLCSRDAEFTIVPQFKPSVTPKFDSIYFCYNAPVKISVQAIAGADYSLLRKTSDVFEIIEQNSNSISPSLDKTGDYQVHINSHGCEFKSHIMRAIQIPADSAYLPNIITPNGDGYNDDLEVITQGIDNYSIRIFNRYGGEVYSGDQSSPNWPGLQDSGVYFWHLSYFSGCDNQVKGLKGLLHVLH